MPIPFQLQNNRLTDLLKGPVACLVLNSIINVEDLIDGILGKGTTLTAPVVSMFFDVESDTETEIATPGGLARLTGKRLKFDKEVALDAVYFVNTADETIFTPVPKGSFEIHTDQRLMFTIPASLASGSYFVEVRRTFTTDNKLRVGRLDGEVTIA